MKNNYEIPDETSVSGITIIFVVDKILLHSCRRTESWQYNHIWYGGTAIAGINIMMAYV
jgi:hypothetical protein